MIRPFLLSDQDGVLAVVRTAFSDATRDGKEELSIVRGTWEARSSENRVELVAEEAGQVVGHVLAASGCLDSKPVDVAGVAPVCVAPEWQRRGIGTALMDSLITEARGRNWAMLVLLGEPGFYGRVGFRSAGPLGVFYPPAGPGSPHFLALPLLPLEATNRGAFTYCWE